jgi:hypothetical protein
MRWLTAMLVVVLAAGALLVAGAPEVLADASGASDPTAVLSADAGGPAGAVPGSDAEATEYARREAASPEVQEFVGGHGTLFGLLVFVALVLLIIWLAKEI